MASKIPKNFRTVKEISATYDWVDIASGTGYVNFYAGNTVDAYRLSNEPFYSDRVASGYAGGAALASPIQNIDFDVEFIKTRIIEGKTVINVPIGQFKTNEDNTNTVYVIAKIYHDIAGGGDETLLAENQGTILTNPAGAGNGVFVYFVSAIDVNIPRTVFKAGETLRLTVELHGTREGAAADFWFFGHDPQNRATTGNEIHTNLTFGTEPSILTFQVPLKLQI